MTEEKKPTEPAIDLSKVQDAVKSAVSSAIADGQRTAQAHHDAAARDAAAREAAGRVAADPVAQVVAPYLTPVVATMNLKSDDAKDAAIFYSTTPEASKFSAHIEAKFNECVQRGQPMNRASIWQWLKGSEAYIAERIKQHDQEVETARQAQTLQGNRGGVPSGAPAVDVNASDDELSKALEGVQF